MEPFCETKLTATEKTVTTLGQQKRANDRIQLVANVADSGACSTSTTSGQLTELVLSKRRRPKLSYDHDQLYLKSCRSTQIFLMRRHKLKLQLVAVSSNVAQGRHTPALSGSGLSA